MNSRAEFQPETFSTFVACYLIPLSLRFRDR